MRTIVVALALVVLAACSAEVKGPRVEVKPPTVVIGPDAGPGFCPPGHAKKGNC